MNQVLRRKILDRLKAAAGTPHVKLPEGIFFSEENGSLIMTFCSKRGFGFDRDSCNMQDNSAAFEGWALVLYVHCLNRGGKICLDIRAEDMPPVSETLYTEYRHYSRFLYRALRFSQQYPWFRLSGRLQTLTEGFDGYLSKYTFTNNPPSGTAGVKEKLENIIENRFAQNDSPLLERLNTAQIYRQLPAGLFRDAVAEKNCVFTGGASAIDLWAISGSTLTVIELKARNKMLGAVTELFFYANYAYDMFVRQKNRFRPHIGSGDRGYGALSSASLEKVCGYLLLDEESRHPLITDSLLKEMSQGAIPYDCLMYRLDTAAEVRLQ